MMILLCFNSQHIEARDYEKRIFLDSEGKISWDSLRDFLNLMTLSAHHLLSLCHPKVKVVLKTSDSGKIEGDHILQVNDNYTNSLKRIAIPIMKPPKVLEAEQEADEKATKTRRNTQIDGAVIRVMKARKRLNHHDLVSEVFTQLRAFDPSRPRRIDQLIDQGYLERDQEDQGIYKYLP
jgi:cullin 3